MPAMRIRNATPEDAERLLEIYAPYVEKTAITFEYDVPSVEEFAGRIARTTKKYPYIVAEEDGCIEGYAYASAFHERAAYDWCVETSIYIAEGARRRGIGKLLYGALEDSLRRMGILNANACIAYTRTEDEHLTNASVDFHKRMGYAEVGMFHDCGFKFGRWYDMIWMEKSLGEHTATPNKVVPFPKTTEKAE